MFMPRSYFLYMLGTPFLKAMGLLYWGTLTQGFPSNPVETVTAALQSEALSVQSCFLPALLSQVSALCHSLKLSLPALLLPPYSSQAFHSTNLLHIWSQSICFSAQTDKEATAVIQARDGGTLRSDGARGVGGQWSDSV